MIDPGHPFSVPYEQLIGSLEDGIREGVEQPAATHFIFQSGITTYELPQVPYAITQVTGLMGKAFTVFQAGVHYRLANNRLVWPDPNIHPDEGSRIDVEYTYRERPAGLTDFNEGSVIGTLLRVVAREIKLLYEQMDQAYRRAFIDVATGVALDNVVALLGIARNPMIKAEGQATFLRKSTTDRAISIPTSTRVTDQSGRAFVTTAPAEIAPQETEFQVQVGGVLHTTDKIAQLMGVWPRASAPNPANKLATKDTAPNLPFGDDERTITLADGVRPTAELRIRYKPKSVTAPIQAVEAGPEGNVNAGTIVVMPTPPTGITGVTNEAPTEGGRSAEPDDQLRERAKHALERAGNATLNALKFAVLDVDEVDGVEVLDHSVDGSIQVGEVRIRYSASDPDKVRPKVQAVVETTRAAGIRAITEAVETLLISGTIYVVPGQAASAADVALFQAAVADAIEALSIGAPLSIRRLNALVYQVGGLADVAEAQLASPAGPVPDPMVIGRTQLLRPDRANLKVVLLRGLKVKESRKAGDSNEIDLQVLDADGAAVEFHDFSVDLSVALEATLKTAPNQPPEHIGSFSRRLTFSGSSIATLTVGPADTSGFRPADHDPAVKVAITAAAYPALAGDDTTIDLTP